MDLVTCNRAQCKAHEFSEKDPPSLLGRLCLLYAVYAPYRHIPTGWICLFAYLLYYLPLRYTVMNILVSRY